MWYPLWSILVCKIPQFGQKLLIWEAHHTFLERRHPEVTKNLYYVLSTEGSQKNYQLMDYNIYRRWGYDSVFLVKHWMFWIPKSCVSNVLRFHSRTIFGLVFIKPFEKDYKYFFTTFSGLQQIFRIFELLLIQQSLTHLK